MSIALLLQLGLFKILTGEPLRRLQEKMHAHAPQDTIEYNFSEPEQSPLHLARWQAEGAAMYGALGIAREGSARHNNIHQMNIVVPVLLVCYFERFNTAPQ